MKKTFYLTSMFDTKSVSNEGKGLQIAGYANTIDKDRTGDIVLPSAWAKGIDNYRTNPVLLFQHNAASPIGKVNKIRVDGKGIFVDATISNAAEKQHSIQTLINDGVLKAFSVGFRVLDQKFDNDSNTSTITDVELLEISVVSVPANQSSLFSVRKSFDSEEDYLNFKKQFDNTEDKSALLVGITTKDSDHYHAYEVDEFRTGSTTYTSHGFAAHTHDIIENVVQEADGHTHDIKLVDIMEGDVIDSNTPTDNNLSEPLEFSFEDLNTKEVDVDEELEEDLETSETFSDPNIQIPFDNQLSCDTSLLSNGTFVKFENNRYKITKIATDESPSFQLMEVDINGNNKNKTLNILATEISIVNEWDIDSAYDIVLHKQDISIDLTNVIRDEIINRFKSLVTYTEYELYKLKDNETIKNNTKYQKKLNKLTNLISISIDEWNDTHFVLAKNICDMIEILKNISYSEESNNSLYELALTLNGYKNLKENDDMTTQDAGSIELPISEKKDNTEDQALEVISKAATTAPAKPEVSEPQVSKLVEKTGEAIMREAAGNVEAKEEVSELRNELKRYKEEVSAMTNSKMVWEQNKRLAEQFTKDDMANAYLLSKALGKVDPFDTKIGMKMKAVTSIDAFLSNFSTNLVEEMEQDLVIAPMLQRVQVDARTFRIPVADEDTSTSVAQFASGTFSSGIGESTTLPTSVQNTLTSVDFTPHKFMASTHVAKDEEEDTILPIMSFLRAGAARRLARAADKSLLRGSGAGSGFTAAPADFVSVIKGVATHAGAIAGLVTTTATAATKATPTDIATARSKMGKYGIRVNGNDLVYITSVEGYNELVQTADFRTVDTFGPQATYHTGTIGSIWGIPVVISEFMDAVGSANSLGVLLYKPGWVVAESRSITVEDEYDPRRQVTAIYMSTRFDMQALTTNASAVLDATSYQFAALIKAAA